MKKFFLFLIALIALNTLSIAQTTPSTQLGNDQGAIFEEHLVAAFSMLALSAEQESSIRNEINKTFFDIDAIKNNASLSTDQKDTMIKDRNTVKNIKIKGIMDEPKYTTWKKIRTNQNELQDVPTLE